MSDLKNFMPDPEPKSIRFAFAMSKQVSEMIDALCDEHGQTRANLLRALVAREYDATFED